MVETANFFSDKKKVTYTLVGICVAALFFVLILPKFTFPGYGALSNSELKDLYEECDKSTFFLVFVYLFPLIAGALTFFASKIVEAVPALKNEKTVRWIFGGILILPFFFCLIGKIEGLGLGAGVIIYLLLSLAYFVVNFLSKE